MAYLGTIRRTFLLSRLGEGDIDHWWITTMASERITISCGSLSMGSGVQGLEVALLDAPPGAMTYAMRSETAADGAMIRTVAVPAAGQYVMRLTKTGQDPEVTGDWVRCGVFLDRAP